MMKWRVVAYKGSEKDVTLFFMLEEAVTFAELIKNDMEMVVVERLGKYTNIRIVEYMDGREL